MISPGTYRARCTGPTDAQWGVSQNGNLQLALVFDLLDEAVAGQRITWIGTFAVGKATDFTLQALENCGWQGSDPTADLTGIDSQDVELVVDTEAGQDGVMRARVRWVNRPGSGRIKFKQPVGPSELGAFSQEIRGAVAARRAGNRSAAPARPRGPAPRGQYPDEDYGGAGEDDLPF